MDIKRLNINTKLKLIKETTTYGKNLPLGTITSLYVKSPWHYNKNVLTDNDNHYWIDDGNTGICIGRFEILKEHLKVIRYNDKP